MRNFLLKVLRLRVIRVLKRHDEVLKNRLQKRIPHLRLFTKAHQPPRLLRQLLLITLLSQQRHGRQSAGRVVIAVIEVFLQSGHHKYRSYSLVDLRRHGEGRLHPLSR
jgi:hypothetical protein